MCLHIKIGRAFDGAGSAELVETVAVFFRNLIQHGECAFTVHTANQRFVGENRLVAQIHDRLVGKGKIEAQRFTVLAALATGVSRSQ
ncbi:hypothetical protein D3C77_688040 [compost metagenome]